MDEKLKKSDVNSKPWVTASGLFKNNKNVIFNTFLLDQFMKGIP